MDNREILTWSDFRWNQLTRGRAVPREHQRILGAAERYSFVKPGISAEEVMGTVPQSPKKQRPKLRPLLIDVPHATLIWNSR